MATAGTIMAGPPFCRLRFLQWIGPVAGNGSCRHCAPHMQFLYPLSSLQFAPLMLCYVRNAVALASRWLLAALWVPKALSGGIACRSDALSERVECCSECFQATCEGN